VKLIRLLPFVLFLCAGCPGESGHPAQDSNHKPPDGWQAGDWPQYPDGPSYQPDLYPWWPDGPQQQPDLYPWWPDQGTYSGSPFGCQQDSDCFGLKCCPTPWGVKLCAEVCQR
jgi:hypothetical protein